MEFRKTATHTSSMGKTHRAACDFKSPTWHGRDSQRSSLPVIRDVPHSISYALPSDFPRPPSSQAACAGAYSSSWRQPDLAVASRRRRAVFSPRREASRSTQLAQCPRLPGDVFFFSPRRIYILWGCHGASVANYPQISRRKPCSVQAGGAHRAARPRGPTPLLLSFPLHPPPLFP